MFPYPYRKALRIIEDDVQNINRDTDIESNCMDAKGEGEDGMNWEIGVDIYTLLIVVVFG